MSSEKSDDCSEPDSMSNRLYGDLRTANRLDGAIHLVTSMAPAGSVNAHYLNAKR